MIWKALVKEHNLGAVIYTIEIKERIIPMNLMKLIMRGQQHQIIMKTLINPQKIIDQQKKEKDYCII